jgi:hypothetical protein
MATMRNNQLARFLRFILNFLFGLSILVSLGLVIWVGVSPIIMRTVGEVGSASVPVRIGTGDEPQFDVNFIVEPRVRVQAAFVREAEGMLYLETESVALIAIANASKLVVLLGLAYIFYLLRAVVQDIETGAPFTEDASKKLRQLGYSVLLLSLLGPLVEFLAAREIFRQLPAMSPPLFPGPTFETGVFFLALMILLLAHVWSYGLELERERALTV